MPESDSSVGISRSRPELNLLARRVTTQIQKHFWQLRLTVVCQSAASVTEDKDTKDKYKN